MKKYFQDLFIHYLNGTNLIMWFSLLWQNKFRVAFKYIPRVIVITLINIISFPLYLVEIMLFKRRIDKTELKEDPVFILGHWRSGTTYLVNLLSRDRGFSWSNILHTFAPSISVIAYWVLALFSKVVMPKTRPMDNVPLRLDLPQEEEYAIANMSPYSFCHMTVFPHNRNQYLKYCIFDELSDKELSNWKKIYVHLIKKLSFQTGGKRMLIKNPVNTSRVKVLLELYPNAKFIHICRNPYEVYASTKKMYETLFPKFTLQKMIDDEAAADFQMDVYEKMYQKFFSEKQLIPSGNLMEVRYEAFVNEPLQTVESIYKYLKLPGFEEAKPHFQRFIAQQKTYSTNTHSIDEMLQNSLNERWREIIQNLGY